MREIARERERENFKFRDLRSNEFDRHQLDRILRQHHHPKEQRGGKEHGPE